MENCNEVFEGDEDINWNEYFRGDDLITIGPILDQDIPWKLASKILGLIQARKASIVLVEIRHHGLVSYTKLADHGSIKYLDSLTEADLPQSVSVWDDQGYYIFLAYDVNGEWEYEHSLIEWDPSVRYSSSVSISRFDIPPIPTSIH